MAKGIEKGELEIERRFLPKFIPADIARGMETGAYPKLLIHQGYLADEKGSRLRDQLEEGNHSYFLTFKEGEGLKRKEIEQEISHSEFLEKWENVTDYLWKTRYLIQRGKHTIELNIFHGPLNGYKHIEVEFASEEEARAFEIPTWFGAEVTDDSRHSNYNLARFSAPKEGVNEIHYC